MIDHHGISGLWAPVFDTCRMSTVTACGVYDTQTHRNMIVTRGVAINIPPRKTTKLWKPKTTGAIAENAAV